MKLDNRYKINDELHYDEVRLVGNDVNSVMTLSDARAIAAEKELDLVEINATANPPIIKLCNFEKMLYEIKRNNKKNKNGSLPIKEVQLSVNIAIHDIETKAKKTLSFLEKGHKVKVILTLKGRELTRKEESKKSLYTFLGLLTDASAIETCREEGNKVIVILKGNKKK